MKFRVTFENGTIGQSEESGSICKFIAVESKFHFGGKMDIHILNNDGNILTHTVETHPLQAIRWVIHKEGEIE